MSDLKIDLLTDEEKQFVLDAKVDAATDSSPRPTVHSLNAELKQLESTITHLIKARRNALVNMEPPTSRYILELERKIVASARRRDEIEALLAERDIAA